MQKLCTVCRQQKVPAMFVKSKYCKDGYSGTCHSCNAAHAHAYYLKNKENINAKRRALAGEAREKLKERKREEYKIHRDAIVKKQQEYYAANKDKILERNRAGYRKNKGRWRENRTLQEKVRYDTDAHFRLVRVLRSRLRGALKSSGVRKQTRTTELLGCCIAQLKAHIEQQFLPGMSWENHGLHGWHIDHIRPCASFDLTDPTQQRQCFHYTNLQPLWAKDNLKKGTKAIVLE